MQRKPQNILLWGSIAASIVLLALTIVSFSESLVLRLVACSVGLVVIVIVGLLATRAISKLSNTLNSHSTRLGNVEHRISDQNFSELEEPLPNLLDAIERNQELISEQVLGVRRQLKVLRNRVPAGYMRPVEEELVSLRKDNQALLRATFESALMLQRDPRSVINVEQARELFRDYLWQGQLLQLRPLIEHFDLLAEQKLSTLRRLFRFYRSTGYWKLATSVIEQLYELSRLETDASAALKLKHEAEVFAHPEAVTVDLPEGGGYDPKGPILHMVGRVLPETQTGYTLRTQYTALAQVKKGLPAVIVGQSGITNRSFVDVEHYTFQGIDYYLLPGPVRNEVLLDDWLRINMRELASLVQRIRPSILHAQSDFFNALIVSAVGEKYGIPTVYESRGFWEYSWLSRTITSNDWRDADTLFSMYGQPDAYTYRKNAEEIARTLPHHVFTHANVMKEHILESASGKISPDQVSIVPNAVEADNFPIQQADESLAAEIGLPTDAVTVGYISSIVEYEGIDTLLDAFTLASREATQPISLLLVGDGDYLATLKARVSDEGIENVYFTGRVPHEDVLRYYGLIDLFVVPRKKSTVADLVTPLKPFEAFATGRAVIVSDVGALREIAEQSKVVSMFRADDPVDLAGKIVELVNAPTQREQLGSGAARWVRNYRSWASNVNEYYRVYRKLGYRGPRNSIIESELALLERDVNPGEVIQAMASAELPPLLGWFSIQEAEQSASSILEEGWRYANFKPVKIDRIKDWTRCGAEHRSWGFNLHSWEFMDPILREYDQTGNHEWLDAACDTALKWIELHCLARHTDDPMVWYDMSLALRLPRLIAVTLRTARLDNYRNEAVILTAAVARHLDELALDKAFNPNNNHGFYTAVSQIHAAKYVPMINGSASAESQGKDRLARIAKSQFAEDGTHLEHSPAYHQMLLGSFELAVQDGLIRDEEIKKRIERAAYVLGWMVQSDGTLVQLGDTAESLVVNSGLTSSNPQTQYILTDGLQGEKPTKEMAVFAAGGYAFVRSPQPAGPGLLHQSGYLAFSAAFHSRAHKHADDLNVVWYDRGQQILTDGGRFGYGELLPSDSPYRRDGFYYAAPERQYVEGTRAHNTLMIDGKNQERRARKPYGSGIRECKHSDGVFDLTGRVQHPDYVHRRRVVYRPGRELLLKDAVYSQSPEERQAIVWLNIAGHFEIESQGQDLILSSDANGEVTRIAVEGPGRLIEPRRGQREPLRGWRSREDQSMEPTWSVGFAFPIETRASVATRLRILS